MIYHVTTKALWEEALQKGLYEAPSLHTEGFIHNSTKEQVPGVLDRYYKGQQDLIILHIEETSLESPLKYELAASLDEMFPHVFGPINISAIVKTELL